MALLSFGNNKIPKTTAIFNLPAISTCPQSTPECRKWCYARKAEIQYPAVLPSRAKNFTLSRSDTFVIQIGEALRKKRKLDTVRIHESGDFYNQKYFDKWIEISRALPDLTFYAYTKNTKIDISKRPDNFIMLLSDDHKLYKGVWSKFNGVATVTKKGGSPSKGYFICPGSCKNCTLRHHGVKENRITVWEH